MKTETTKHTAGPWIYDAEDDFHNAGGAHITDADMRELCLVEDGNRANARLIAAAPDLLAACKIVEAMNRSEARGIVYADGKGTSAGCSLDEKQVATILAAIAKAESTGND